MSMYNSEKEMLRREVRKRLGALGETERKAASVNITQQVLSSSCFQQARTVMVFLSLPTEPDTQEIIQRAVIQGKQVLLPRCLHAPQMEALPWRGEEYLRKGPYGILEPVPLESEKQNSAEADLILVPCLAATKDGARLGHGGGYYDWYLSKHSAVKIALCFQMQLVDTIPMEPTDVWMDQVITEQVL